MATATASVVAAAAGATKPGAPSGPSAMLATATGRIATAISTITVPETAGVTTRRRRGSHPARANWNSAAATTRPASSAGPPVASAVAETARYWGAVPVSTMALAPKRLACTAVAIPFAISAAKIAHAR